MRIKEFFTPFQETYLQKSQRQYWLFVISLAMVCVVLGILNITERLDPEKFQYLRFLAVLPVVTVAYYFGVIQGLAIAILLGFAFLVQFYFSVQNNGFSVFSFELVTLVLSLIVIAFVIGDITVVLRQKNNLKHALQDREILLGRTLNLDELVYFLLGKVSNLVNGETSFLVLRSPVTQQWMMYTHTSKRVLPTSLATEPANLADWILDKNESFIVNNLDFPEGVILNDDNAEKPAINSLLCKKLQYSDGMQMGFLAILNKYSGYFEYEDLAALDEIISAGEKAIEQAEQYAKTDYALERRVAQLAVIQRASKELNAKLDPDSIINLALDIAIEITQGDCAALLHYTHDWDIYQKCLVPDQDKSQTESRINRSIQRGTIQLADPNMQTLPLFFQGTRSNLFSIIRHGERNFGVVIVESRHEEAFDQTTQYVLNLLADHVGVSMENARLFQQVTQEKQQVANIVSSVSNALMTVDEQGFIQSVNPALAVQTEWGVNELPGMHTFQALGWMTAEHHKFRQEFSSACKGFHPINIELVTTITKTGNERKISLSGSPTFNSTGDPIGLVILMRDLTEREELNRLQEELIASMSHEMRTPLAKISSISELIGSELRGEIKPNYERYLDTLIYESQRLSQFLDRILDVHQLETNQFVVEPRPLPLNFMVENLVAEWRLLQPTRKIIISMPPGSIWVIADENGLHSILSNLIDNAHKYSPIDRPIKIELRDMVGDKITVCVHDEGSGISFENQAQIFERFYRVNGQDSQWVYGHGIGLYVAKMLVEAMNGEIWVESKPGMGSCFKFTLPLLREELNETQDSTGR